MNVTEWEEQYRPIPNHLDSNASWQDEDGVGVMFETYGEEVEFVKSQDTNCIWTYYDDGEGGTHVIAGWHLINRIGYFITEVPWTDEWMSIKVGDWIDEDMCEMCESNEKESNEGKWCTSCKDDYKESESA
jgi:hypothetical protein